MNRILLAGFFALSATAFAASSTVKVDIYQDSVVEGKTLKAGEYKVSVADGNAIFKKGKETVEVPAKMETEPNKIENTSVTYRGDTQIVEIRVGGTHNRIVLNGSEPTHAGE